MKHFLSRIIGRELIVRTDSQSIGKGIINPIGDQSPMEQRYITATNKFNPIIQDIAGTDNKVSDTLSRPPHTTSKHIVLQDNYPDYIYRYGFELF